MNKLVCTLALALSLITAQAKYIRFTVDMTDQVVNVAGVHLTGDFQALLGLTGGDWQSNTLTMEQQADTNMYSVVLNLPAFRKYEYKFVNGDQFYQVEFVPIESRVGYDFNDNRWLYLDSLNTDTTFIGALKFGENAPAGLQLMRYLVDMQSVNTSANGVHVVGSFSGWDPTAHILYSFIDGIYEVITYAPAGNYDYNFVNGNQISDTELISDTCTNAEGHRVIDLQTHTILPTVCYGACTACVVSNTLLVEENRITAYPNPTEGLVQFNVPVGSVKEAFILDASGREVLHQSIQGVGQFEWDMRSCASGLYYARLAYFNGHTETIKVYMR
jgi:hypothetical protein